MITFVAIVVGCFWLWLIFWLAYSAMDEWYNGHRTMSISLACSAIFVFALPFGIISSLGEHDPHASQLCIHGHETWVTTHSGPYLVGRVWMPATDSTEKVWVCDEWER